MLRPMTEAEYSHWRADAVRSYAADKVLSGQWTGSESLVLSERTFASLLPEGRGTAGHHLFSIVDESGRCVGAVWLAREERPAGSVGYVYDLVVWEEHRRRGHAERAMRLLEREAAGLGYAGLALHVFGHNAAARALYRKLGYEPTDINMFKPVSRPGDAA